jgi:hypothetical protein
VGVERAWISERRSHLERFTEHGWAIRPGEHRWRDICDGDHERGRTSRTGRICDLHGDGEGAVVGEGMR